jgi:hypothetical protein
MKKRTKQLLTIIFVFAIILFGVYCFGWIMGESFDPSHTYEVPARVSEVDKTTGWVNFVDWKDEVWCIRDDSFEVGELVIVVFNDNNTKTIYDDTVVEVLRAEVQDEVIIESAP